MAAAQIRWDPGDSAGERTLITSGSEGRFNGWKIQPMGIGERAVSVGDGLTHVWTHRTDQGVAFRFSVLEEDQSLLSEFLEWANLGRLFAIDTNDAEDNTYEEVCIAPGTLFDAGEPDPTTLDIPVAGSVINAAASPVPMRQILTPSA
jgi:hypothetical protein